MATYKTINDQQKKVAVEEPQLQEASSPSTYETFSSSEKPSQ